MSKGTKRINNVYEHEQFIMYILVSDAPQEPVMIPLLVLVTIAVFYALRIGQDVMAEGERSSERPYEKPAHQSEDSWAD